MKGWHIVVGGIALVALGIVAMYFLFPQVTVEPARNYVRGQAKLTKKEIAVGDHSIVYLEGGKGEPVVLVHGFASNKDSWTRLGGRLVSMYRVIALDLPGFGASTRKAAADYGYEAQVERLGAFASALGLDRFHLGGHAMGAAIASLYAEEHPDRVRTLALFAPAGIRTPEPSDYELARREGKEPLSVDSVEDLDRFLSYVFVLPPDIPGVVKRGLVVEARENRAFYEELGQTLLRRSSGFIEPVLEKIELPTLVVWCKKDRLIHPSGASVAQRLLPRSKVTLLDGCGHAPHGERPVPVGQAYLDFMQEPVEATANRTAG